MVLVGVRIDSRDHAASEIRHPSSHRPFGSGRQAGTGGHNSDEALAANRFLSSHDRPGPAAHNGRKRAARQNRHVPSTTHHAQFANKSDPDEHP
jgi:hypothetical protein